jgi:hypothetical protein
MDEMDFFFTLSYIYVNNNNNIKVNEREANKIFLIKTKHGKAPEQ